MTQAKNRHQGEKRRKTAKHSNIKLTQNTKHKVSVRNGDKTCNSKGKDGPYKASKTSGDMLSTTSMKGKFKQHRKSKKGDEDDDNNFEEVRVESTCNDSFPEKQALQHDSENDDIPDTQYLVRQQNRKKKKSGGFQSMGLSHAVFKGVMKKGYKIPTPIQRKTIPLILDGKDVVAMARTGSGKTAAFLVPMFEKLKTHLASGARALVLAPTRELALQTLKFTKEIGKYTGLKSAVILGGDKMEDQFAAIHENPDILIATPGRFMHLLVEMELKLQDIQYVVFDEADRLFEMGFAEQLQEILNRLPETRQTLLFSATLPKLLVEFAKAGLHDPTLIRLDVDSKISANLKMAFLACRSDDKTAILLHLLRNVVKPSEQTVVFAATKHHVEYLNMILGEAGIPSSYSYSSLDQTARKINVAKFRANKTSVLLVTDLAARGIDIPMLDNVINYNFPAKAKLFIHRVGRVARAGRSGTAFSLVSPDEQPYMLDLHLFLGRPLKWTTPGKKYTDADSDGLIGRVPQSVMDEEEQDLRHWHEKADIGGMKKVITNAHKQYIRSRPPSSSESTKRMKETAHMDIGFHPVFESSSEDLEAVRSNLLESMKNYKPSTTILEVNSTNKSQAFSVMKKKRDYHGNVIAASAKSKQEKSLKFSEQNSERTSVSYQELTSEQELQDAFGLSASRKSINSSDQEPEKKRQKLEKRSLKDEENYISYRPKDDKSEKMLGLGTSFEREAATASLDLAGDDENKRKAHQNTLKWDRKKKKFVSATGCDAGGNKKIRTESGAWVKASYKSNIYQEWLDKNKVAEQEEEEEEDEVPSKKGGKRGRRHGKGKRFEVLGSAGKHRKGGGSQKGSGPPVMDKRHQGGKKELRKKEQILKGRRQRAKQQAFQKHRTNARRKK